MRRVPVLAAFAAAAALAIPAHAAPEPQIVDPKGDYPAAGADIVSVLFESKGKTMTITMELAAAANTPVNYSYQVQFTAGDCDWRGNAFTTPDVSTNGGCRSDNSSVPSGVKIDGNKVIWTVPIGGALKAGTVLTGLNANNSPGGALAGGQSSMLGDGATSEKTYKIGS